MTDTSIIDWDAGSAAFQRQLERAISLDATLAAIRLQILQDERDRRANAPMRKLIALAQTWLLRGYGAP